MVIVSVSMIVMSGLLIPSTYALTECDVTITSDPPGANVYIDDRLVGVTPYVYAPGEPFGADVRIELEGFETYTTVVRVGSYEHEFLDVDLVPLAGGMESPGEGAVTVTKTVSATITLTSSTTATTTSTTTNTVTSTSTTTMAERTVTEVSTALKPQVTLTTTNTITSTSTTTMAERTVTSSVTTASTLTVTSTAKESGTTITSEITEQVGLPLEITYGAIGIAVVAIAAAAYMTSRRRV